MKQTDEERAAELAKADRDMRLYGTGAVRQTPEGIKHVPLEELTQPPTGDASRD